MPHLGTSPRPPGRTAHEPVVYAPHGAVVVASSMLAIVLAALAGAGIAAAIAALGRGEQSAATVAMLEVILVVPFALVLWRQSRLRIEVDVASIRVTNYFSSYRIVWQEVQRFERGSGALGITAVMRDGTERRLNAVQRPKLTARFRSPSEADEVVRELNRRLYSMRFETTSRRSLRPGGPDPGRDHDERERRGAQAVPQEDREVAPS